MRLFPLEDGLKEWAGSDEAKTYLPPKGAEGTGDGVGGNGGQGKKTIALAGFMRSRGEADACINRLLADMELLSFRR